MLCGNNNIAVVLFDLMSKKCVFTSLFTSAYKIHLCNKKVGALHAESLKKHFIKLYCPNFTFTAFY